MTTRSIVDHGRINWGQAFAALAALALTTCSSTPDELTSRPNSGVWQFAAAAVPTAECLTRGLNTQFATKTPAQAFWGRSIGHNVSNGENGALLVVHEHIGPSTMWTFKIRPSGKGSIAEAYVGNTASRDSVAESMATIAKGCAGTPV